MAGKATRPAPAPVAEQPARLNITGLGEEPAAARSGSPTESRDAGQPDLAVRRVRPAYEQVAEQLRNLMLTAELSPGQRLPSEGELAAMFGVGRTTIREGLRLLASQQLLVTTRGVKGGTFVVTPDADNISRYLETSIGLLTGTNRLSVAELLEARTCLELPAVRSATERSDEDQLAAVAITVGPQQSVHMEHSNFHVAILKASGNRMLEVMARPIFDVLRTRLDRGAAPADFWDRVREDHARILTAMQSRDVTAADHEMDLHLNHLASVYTSIDVAVRDARNLAKSQLVEDR